MPRDVLILAAPLSKDPVSWVHRYEARAIWRELRSFGYDANLQIYRNDTTFDAPILLRLPDNFMRGATRELTGKGLPYAGPSYRVLESCYDKLFAYRTIGAAGIDYPPTSWDAQSLSFQKPFLVKPRRGSDSLGVRILPNHIPAKYRTEHFLIQQFVDGKEITVGYLDGLVGHPFEILRPPGTIYSFARKNIFRTRKRPLEDAGSVNKIGEVVKKVCSLMGIDWAARVDFLYETREERLYFLECDAAPLIHKTSAFAMTLELAGMNRPLQIEALLRTEQRV